MAYGAWWPLGFWDEALLFTDAFLMDRGQVIYRDFYVNYPPGILQLVRLIIALGLPPIWSTRVLALAVRLASAALAGLVVGRLRGERAGLAAAALVLLLQAQQGYALSAYIVVVLMVLVTIWYWPDEGAGRAHRLACGASLGLMSYFRHDLFAYAMLALAALEVAHLVARRRSLLAGTPRGLAEIAGAAGATALLLWVPLFVRSGWALTLKTLVADQARVMPTRVLPLPSFTAAVDVPGIGPLPALVASRLCVALLLGVAGALCGAGLVFWWALRTERPRKDVATAALLAAFAAATLPQALLRVDYGHVTLGAPLTVAALLLALGPRAGWPLVLLAAFACAVERPPLAATTELLRFLKPRDDAEFVTPARRRLARFIEAETGHHEPIFVGCTSHRRVLANKLDVYYLVRRTGATRYAQLDPGIATSAEGQREIIADLERHRPRIALRHPSCAWDEPNASSVEGAGLLDAYLAERYAPERRVGGFEVWRRK